MGEDLVRAARNALGRVLGFGACGRCGDTWNWKRPHETPYGDGCTCFPLCEDCWAELTPEGRVPFYDARADEWIRALPDLREEIEGAREEIREAVRGGG